MSAMTDTDAWTCPRCEQTTRGNSRTRRHAQRTHARRHAGQLADTMSGEPATPAPLVIPPAPRDRRRHR